MVRTPTREKFIFLIGKRWGQTGVLREFINSIMSQQQHTESGEKAAAINLIEFPNSTFNHFSFLFQRNFSVLLDISC